MVNTWNTKKFDGKPEFFLNKCLSILKVGKSGFMGKRCSVQSTSVRFKLSPVIAHIVANLWHHLCQETTVIYLQVANIKGLRFLMAWSVVLECRKWDTMVNKVPLVIHFWIYRPLVWIIIAVEEFIAITWQLFGNHWALFFLEQGSTWISFPRKQFFAA